MNPQPFSSLNHLTVPTATMGLLVSLEPAVDRSRREPQRQPHSTGYLVGRERGNRNLLPPYERPGGGVLDDPAPSDQFVAQSVGLGEVAPGPGEVAPFHQFQRQGVGGRLVGPETETQRGEEHVDGPREGERRLTL